MGRLAPSREIGENRVMVRFRPVHGVVLVVVFMTLFLVVNYAHEGGFEKGFQRIGPDPDGNVRIDVGDLEAGDLRFYRFLNPSNQEVKLFVGRDRSGEIHVGFDANEICFKRKRGYDYAGGWLTCRVCEKSFRLEEVNDNRGGCAPVAVRHQLEGDQVVLAESAVLEGWRFFR